MVIRSGEATPAPLTCHNTGMNPDQTESLIPALADVPASGAADPKPADSATTTTEPAANGPVSFDGIAASFRWQVPARFNISDWVCERHADGSHRVAMMACREGADDVTYTFDQINRWAASLAGAFGALGCAAGDRVAVILPQRLETALLHVAAHKAGLVSLPLSVLFGDDALAYRLQDSGTRLVVTTAERAGVIASIAAQLPELNTVLVVPDQPVSDETAATVSVTLDDRSAVTQQNFWQALLAATPLQTAAVTQTDDPAFLLYTSGTTGPPKGALIPHRALIGNLTGFEMSQNGYPRDNDIFYTPADWAWTGGLLDGLMPAWFYGTPVVGFDAGKFDAEAVLSVMSRHRVTCAFIPPTALKMIRAEAGLLDQYPLSLRAIMSAGEAVGDALFSWGREVLGLDINEMCGQTEHNYVMGNCSLVMPVKPGSMGKAYPGHRVAIMAEDQTLCAPGVAGEIVVHRDDPVHFLGYWNKPDATAEKYTGEWFHTGDIGLIDEDGYCWFQGRADDVISSAGYRIGPGEIEDCALRHPAVLQAAAIGVPDPDGIRGDIVKLCVVLKEGYTDTAALKTELADWVRRYLAAYEYPRLIEIFDALPMTTTGKVRRKALRDSHGYTQ